MHITRNILFRSIVIVLAFEGAQLREGERVFSFCAAMEPRLPKRMPDENKKTTNPYDSYSSRVVPHEQDAGKGRHTQSDNSYEKFEIDPSMATVNRSSDQNISVHALARAESRLDDGLQEESRLLEGNGELSEQTCPLDRECDDFDNIYQPKANSPALLLQEDFSRLSTKDNPIIYTVARKKFCTYDAVEAIILLPERLNDAAKYFLERKELEIRRVDDSAQYSAREVETKIVSAQEYSNVYVQSATPYRTVPSIRCLEDAISCAPALSRIETVDDVHLTTGSGVLDYLDLVFDQETNTPQVVTPDQIMDLLNLPQRFPPLLGGRWIDLQTLRLSLPLGTKDEAKSLILSALDNESPGNPKLALLRLRQLYTSQQNIYIARFRISQPGFYQLTTPDGVASHAIEVHQCGNDIIDFTYRKEEHPSRLFESPRYHAKGIIALAGDVAEQSLTIPAALISSAGEKGWSLSFWLFPIPAAHDNLRTVFYKGNLAEHRTPSCWLGSDGRLHLRVSTELEADIGHTSFASLNHNQWNHIVVSFLNTSDRADFDSKFTMTLFIDGKADVKMQFRDSVSSNDADLWIGGSSGWRWGISGLISNVQLYHTALWLEDAAVLHRRQIEIINRLDTWLTDRLRRLDVIPASPLESSSSYLSNKRDTNYLFQEYLRLKDDCSVSRVFVLDALKEASEAQDAQAIYELGNFFLTEEADVLGLSSCASEKHLYFEERNGTMALAQFEKAMGAEAGTSFESEQTGIPDFGYAPATFMLGVLKTYGIGESHVSSIQHLHTDHLTRERQGASYYHLAAFLKEPKSLVALAKRYLDGRGVLKDLTTAAHYYYQAAQQAQQYYHSPGHQPRHEMHRLTTDTLDTIDQGERGEEDERIGFINLRADQGDVDAIITLGDWHYWGSHGLPRDHRLAADYFQRAVDLDSDVARSALGGMYRRGEGVPKDDLKALGLWEQAANSSENVRALNGLGHLYFYGIEPGELAANQTKAFEYFERAAERKQDGDSLYNAGTCLERGLGVDRNLTRAANYYQDAAALFGHFDSVLQLGKMHYLATGGVEYSIEKALIYLRHAAEQGEWGSVVRKAFDAYLEGDEARAVALYAQAAEYGYDIATDNMLFISILQPRPRSLSIKSLVSAKHSAEQEGIGSLFGGSTRSLRETLRRQFFFRQLYLAAAVRGQSDYFIALADSYYNGDGGNGPWLEEYNMQQAAHWYSRASAAGSAMGAYSLGYLYEHEMLSKITRDLAQLRAHRYYEKAIELEEDYGVRLALKMNLVRFKVLQSTPSAFLSIAKHIVSLSSEDASLLLLLVIMLFLCGIYIHRRTVRCGNATS